MPANPPLVASGSRDPDRQRPRPIPRPVRRAIEIMVRGRPDDPDARPLSFIEAAKLCDIKPDIMRRWLDRGEVRRFLLAERRAFRDTVCAGNELALQRVRDGSVNGMAICAAVRGLEGIADADPVQPGGVPRQPGCVIMISPALSHLVEPRPGVTIDVTPVPEVDRDE